jgi:hypothetical protein
MNNQPSPIETLRQLREMLDAGTITTAEFEALKQQLIFSSQTPPAAAAPAPEVSDPAGAPPAPAGQSSPMFEDAQLPPGSPDLDVPLPAAAPEPAATLRSPTTTTTETEQDSFAQPPARNPLNLVLAIGGLLVLLSVVAYLAFNRHDSEHISSSSMTAADSLNMSVEEGPQAAPVEQPVAVPETVRVAPANPAPPVVKPSVAPAATDSTAAMPAAADSTTQP